MQWLPELDIGLNKRTMLKQKTVFVTKFNTFLIKIMTLIEMTGMLVIKLEWMLLRYISKATMVKILPRNVKTFPLNITTICTKMMTVFQLLALL